MASEELLHLRTGETVQSIPEPTELVVCRECGQKLASISTVHLRSHELTWKSYQIKWPNAPMLSDQTRANVNTAALKYSASHREVLRDYSAGWRKDQKNKPKLKAQNKRAITRRRAHPEPHRAYDRRWYRKTKITKASASELELFLKDPGKCKYVVCLESDVLCPEQLCRAKLKDIGCAHLPKIHGLTPDEYSEKHGMPIKVAAKRRKTPGRKPVDPALVAEVEQLHEEGVKFPAIRQRIYRKYGVLRSTDAYEKMVTRRRRARADADADKIILSARAD